MAAGGTCHPTAERGVGAGTSALSVLEYQTSFGFNEAVLAHAFNGMMSKVEKRPQTSQEPIWSWLVEDDSNDWWTPYDVELDFQGHILDIERAIKDVMNIGLLWGVTFGRSLDLELSRERNLERAAEQPGVREAAEQPGVREIEMLERYEEECGSLPRSSPEFAATLRKLASSAAQ